MNDVSIKLRPFNYKTQLIASTLDYKEFSIPCFNLTEAKALIEHLNINRNDKKCDISIYIDGRKYFDSIQEEE